MLVTPPATPPVQALKLRTPAPLVCRQLPLPPSAFGNRNVKLLVGSVDGADNETVCVPPTAASLKLTEPAVVPATPRLRLLVPWITKLPLAVSVVPDSVKEELAIVPAAVNLLIVPAMPEPTIPPPLPVQFPAVEHIE